MTVETHGSNCFYQSLSLHEGPFTGSVQSRKVPEGTTAEYDKEHNVTIAHIAKLTSRATSLGATSPSAGAVKMALQRSGSVKSVCVSDELAMQTCLLFTGEHGSIFGQIRPRDLLALQRTTKPWLSSLAQ